MGEWKPPESGEEKLRKTLEDLHGTPELLRKLETTTSAKEAADILVDEFRTLERNRQEIDERHGRRDLEDLTPDVGEQSRDDEQGFFYQVVNAVPGSLRGNVLQELTVRGEMGLADRLKDWDAWANALSDETN